MNHEEKLTALIEKYRKNRENVPLDTLKTKYAVPYNQLIEEIKAELKYIAVQFPPWLKSRSIRQEYADEIAEIFNRLYEAGGYSRKLGAAAFKNRDAPEAIRIAKEIAATFQREVEEYTAAKACLYATEPCWNQEAPQTPKIYNDLLRMFWDEGLQAWREPEPGETEPAILIFLNKGEQGNE